MSFDRGPTRDRRSKAIHLPRSLKVGFGGFPLKAFQMEDVFPLSLDELWNLLHAHVDEGRLREIHPRFLSGQSIREGDIVEFHGLSYPREKVAERVIRIGGRPSKSTWTYRIEPPTRYAYEVVFPNGSMLRIDNSYSSTGGGTLVKTSGEVSLKQVPSFLAVGIVKRSFNRSDREDLAFARRMVRSNERSR